MHSQHPGSTVREVLLGWICTKCNALKSYFHACPWAFIKYTSLTGSDVEPVLIAGSQLFMLGQLNNVNPVWHLQLPRPVKTPGFKMSFSTHSQNYFIMVSQAYKNKNNHRRQRQLNWLLEEGSQRADKLLLVDVFHCYTTAWHLKTIINFELIT